MKCVFLTWIENWFLTVRHIAAVFVRMFVASPARAFTPCCVVALLDKQNTVSEWLCDNHLYLV